MRLPAPLLRNKRDVHKHTFGHVLVVAGSAPMLGAGALTSLAALRSGAGLVTFVVPKKLILTAQKKVSNCVMVSDVETLRKKPMPQNAVIALGPGLGRSAAAVKFVQWTIKTSPIPLVIDADALYAVSKKLTILTQSKTPKILTPHPGEMRMLTGETVTQKNREKLARDFAKKYGCVLLLKGHRTVVSDGQKTYINKTGNPGMATAGSGDVLTGMIAAFLAQGLSAFDAAKWGAHLHGKAGDLAVKSISKTSLIADDLIANLSKVLKG